MNHIYSIIDIETTGLNTSFDKITEIAVILTDGDKILKSFSSLVNPERRVSSFITRLTGITNEMLIEAPRFQEISDDLLNLIDDTIFVAHNVDFDYGFVKSEFKRLGHDFRLKKLCTVKLSRNIVPGNKTYRLDKICEHLNIDINNRHRAYGDAIATFELFKKLYKLDLNENDGNTFKSFLLNLK